MFRLSIRCSDSLAEITAQICWGTVKVLIYKICMAGKLSIFSPLNLILFEEKLLRHESEFSFLWVVLHDILTC